MENRRDRVVGRHAMDDGRACIAEHMAINYHERSARSDGKPRECDRQNTGLITLRRIAGHDMIPRPNRITSNFPCPSALTRVDVNANCRNCVWFPAPFPRVQRSPCGSRRPRFAVRWARTMRAARACYNVANEPGKNRIFTNRVLKIRVGCMARWQFTQYRPVSVTTTETTPSLSLSPCQ
jgi:hypothetical protein